jgi:SAM-dependent methyltransferase
MPFVRPIDVAIDQTLDFLHRILPAPPLRVLEVGCGSGDLARRLLREGFEVTALDASSEAVRAARAAGVPAVEADFLGYNNDPYDVVLFVRSLHHMRSLSDAVVRAAALLHANGWLIAEEFARERADRETAAWFYDNRELLRVTGVLTNAGDGPTSDASDSTFDPLERWRVDHKGETGHPLHDRNAMLAEIERRFEIIDSQDVPYLYRYLSQWIEESPRGCALAHRLLEIETRRIAQMLLAPIGFRVVAKKPLT